MSTDTHVVSVNHITRRYMDVLNKLNLCVIIFTVEDVSLHWSTYYSSMDTDEDHKHVRIYFE